MKRSIILVLVALLLLPAALFAQRGATQTAPAPTTFNLTINVSPANANAQIFVDNVEIKGNVATVQGGNRAIRVTANGYIDFTTTVNVTGNTTVPVALQARTANLTINVSPANIGAQIFVDNVEIKGNVATVQLGNRAIKVTAPGYIDFTQTINVTANTTVPVTLQARTANLTINVNPGNIAAQIFIDNVEIKGNVATVQLGNRTIRVSAPNYIDFTSTINVTGNATVPVSLQPATATVNINVSADYQARELGNRFFAQLTIFVDGQRQNMPANATSLNIPAGQRTIRIVSGGMQSEITYNFLPGKTYTVEPVFTIMVKE